MAIVRVLVNDTSYEVDVIRQDRDAVEFRLSERTFRVEFEKEVPNYTPETRAADAKLEQAAVDTNSQRPLDAGAGLQVVAPIPGVVVEVLVRPGDSVAEGEVVLRLEAMKMQNNIFAPCAGTVASVNVATGEEVADGQLLLEIHQ